MVFCISSIFFSILVMSIHLTHVVYPFYLFLDGQQQNVKVTQLVSHGRSILVSKNYALDPKNCMNHFSYLRLHDIGLVAIKQTMVRLSSEKYKDIKEKVKAMYHVAKVWIMLSS
jgi:hypothetical protein